MRKGYSRTAEAVALARALHQMVPASQRILEDPYAAAFLQHPYLKLAAASRIGSWMTSRALDFWAIGGQEFIAIRARFADDLAKKMAREGMTQLVLLGAGFDSMALRIRDSLSGITVFEVDHPETQAVKRTVMNKLGTPANVRFAAVDFEKDDFAEKLREAGFSSGAAAQPGTTADSQSPANATGLSLIVWMGVSYYLTSQAMSRALGQIATLGGPGLILTFDYFLQDLIDGTTRNRDALAAARRVAQIGEPWIFGFKPEKLPDYLAAFGFTLSNDFGSDELRREYCPRSLKPIDYARIAVCKKARW
ncbi:MAG: class I SAM-dependent methyltransferase, partial [Blastocatellia bacterium]